MIITQGESYPIYIRLWQDGQTLTPAMISALKVCIGGYLSKTYGSGEVKYDPDQEEWYIWPTEEETLNLPDGSHAVCCHVKYPDGTKLIEQVGRIRVKPCGCGGRS